MRSILLTVLMALSLVACQAGEPVPEPEKTIGLSLYGLNYTDVPIGVFYVNGVWGGSSTPYAAGLKTAGAIGLPEVWRPGIKVTVKWQDDILYAQDKDGLITREVEIPRYGKIYSGYLLVAFLPGREVKVYASDGGPGRPDTPGGLMNPGEYCEAQPGCIEWYRSDKPPREGHY